jgi:hypothetical protein
VARRFECSEVARTAYGACTSDRRSVGAWTERAPNLRGREGVKSTACSLSESRSLTEHTGRAASHVLYIFDDDGDLLSQSHYMDVDEGWKRLVTVHDRALHSPSQPIIRVPQHLLATTTTHMTHVFTDSELLVGGSPGETSRYAQSLAERLVGLLCLQGENSRLPSGTYVNAANLNGRAVCGVITGGSKEPLGATV